MAEAEALRLKSPSPEIKIISFFLFAPGLFLIKTPPGLFLTLALAAAACLASRVSPDLIWKQIRPVLLLVIFTAAAHGFFTPGHSLWEAGPLVFSQEGAVQGTLLAGKLLLLVTVSSLLTLSTPPAHLIKGLEKILKPLGSLGVSSRDLALVMLMALRFIPILNEEAERILKAQAARGGKLKGYKTYSLIIIPLFIAGIRRSVQLALALEVRGYRSGLDIPTRPYQFRLADLMLAAIVLTYTTAALAAGI